MYILYRTIRHLVTGFKVSNFTPFGDLLVKSSIIPRTRRHGAMSLVLDRQASTSNGGGKEHE